MAKDRDYARSNIFVGKYEVPEDGWVALPNAKIRYMLQLPSGHAFLDETPKNRRAYPDAPRWLILEDGDFWPVMLRLDEPATAPGSGAN
jgi:hypothetical protein